MAVLIGLRASQHRCHRAAAVDVACSCGHGAVDCIGPSQAALRVRKGTLELVPPLVTAVGDPLVGDQPESSLPCSADGMEEKKTEPFLSISLRWMTSGPSETAGPTCQFKW
jgi:hypothetical protein